MIVEEKIKALKQARAKGTVTTEELRRMLEASIPVSEFAEYCRALGENRYSNAFDIRNGKGDNWIKEMFDKLENNNEEFKKLYQGNWIDECTPITKSNFEKLMSIKKPKTKEMKKEIIGYNFKDEKSYYAFRAIYHSLKKSIDRDFNLKNPPNIKKKFFEVDIKNQDCNIYLRFAKKHNLLDELFTPVYKEENKLQSGKWYKTNEDRTLWFINSINDKGDGNGYGFLFGQWEESNTIALNNKKFDFKEASKEYVESMLIKEAKKRGLKEGVIANSMDGKESFRIKGGLYFSKQMNTLYCELSDRYAPILENGIWIELKKEGNYKTEFDTSCIYESKTKEIIQLYKEVVDNAVKNNLTTIDIQGVFKAIEVLILKKDQ